jgi:hypothetical protein
MKAQLVNLDTLLKQKRGWKRGERTWKWKKGKEASHTCQATPNFVECALKSSHKAPKTRMFKTSRHLKFLEATKSDTLHWRFKAKCLVFQRIQAHSWLLKLDLHYAFNTFALHAAKSTLTTTLSLLS